MLQFNPSQEFGIVYTEKYNSVFQGTVTKISLTKDNTIREWSTYLYDGCIMSFMIIIHDHTTRVLGSSDLGSITFKCNRLHYNYLAIFMITLHYDYINFQMKSIKLQSLCKCNRFHWKKNTQEFKLWITNIIKLNDNERLLWIYLQVNLHFYIRCQSFT